MPTRIEIDTELRRMLARSLERAVLQCPNTPTDNLCEFILNGIKAEYSRREIVAARVLRELAAQHRRRTNQ